LGEAVSALSRHRHNVHDFAGSAQAFQGAPETPRHGARGGMPDGGSDVEAATGLAMPEPIP
jgi:hypothetical protein